MFKKGFYGGKFMPFHRGHLNCILRAMSQCEELYVVLMYGGEQELELQKHECPFGSENLSVHTRELAIRRELNDFPNVHVIVYDSEPADKRAEAEGKHPWYYECRDMLALIGDFDVAYSSEPEYDELFKTFYPNATSVLLDVDRAVCPISGTMIRNTPFKDAYAYLTKSYQQLVNKTVLCAGTCSCGKTTTVKKLAKYYNTTSSYEYGRSVSESFKNISSPGEEWYDEFVCGQYMLNADAKRNANMVTFLDTDAVVTQFYSELYEKQHLESARAIASSASYDMVLFFEPTVPFVYDGLRTRREEAQRWELSDRLKKVYLELYGDKVHILNGDYEKNFTDAIALTDKLLVNGGR